MTLGIRNTVDDLIRPANYKTIWPWVSIPLLEHRNVKLSTVVFNILEYPLRSAAF